MTARFLAIALICAAMGLAGGQTKKREELQALGDRAGRFRIADIVTAELRSDEKEGTQHFDFSGRPLIGFSKDQGLEFRSDRAAGAFKPGNKFSLQNMTLAGNVWIKVSKNDDKKKTSTDIEATSEKLTLVDSGDSAKITSPGPIKVIYSGVGQGKRRLELQGPNATLVIDPLNQKSEDPLQKAVMAGRVTVLVDSISVDKEGKENKVVLTVTGDRLDYDRTTREVVISGNVKVEGANTSPGKESDVVFEGTLTGKEFRLKLDKGNEIVSWSLGQGKASFREGG